MEMMGKYELIRPLATGGMAELFLARSQGVLGFEKMVVVKRIRPHLLDDPQFLLMFLNEARIAARLNHPNIVQIYDFGEAAASYFIAMEYVDGPNLRTLATLAHAAGKPISFPLCAKIISYACDGLAFAHEAMNPETQQPLSIVHRDMSPDNIVLARNGAVKVVDFGIAKAAEQLYQTQSGLRKGKVAYMAPEYLQGQPLDRRADIYALGVVLYELISTRQPYEAESDLLLMLAKMDEPMVPLRTRRPDVPKELETAVARALARNRDDRYPSCRELQADLERFVVSAGEPLGQVHLSQLVASVSISHDATSAKTPGRSGSTLVRAPEGARGQKTSSLKRRSRSGDSDERTQELTAEELAKLSSKDGAS